VRLAKPPDLDVVQVHLDRNDAPIFENTQPWRIAVARGLVWRILDECPMPATIWELGCGSADISGAFSNTHEVRGVDVVPVAQEIIRERWPNMNFRLARVEDVEPQDSDILVLTEVLEHLTDPLRVVTDWMPRAAWSVIGHPLVGHAADDEPGHRWAYDHADFINWFTVGGHQLLEAFQFSMGPYPNMVIGVGHRA
jgi:trans-aconitate methyltransferase